jgi:hypothetical protein
MLSTNSDAPAPSNRYSVTYRGMLPCYSGTISFTNDQFASQTRLWIAPEYESYLRNQGLTKE